MDYTLLYHKGKRPDKSKNKLKEELLFYISGEYKKGHIPSKRELQSKFHLRIDEPIQDLYKQAGLKYKLTANQNIKVKKAELFLDTILNNLNRLGLKLIEYRGVTERGIDIIATDGIKIVGIELKAYNQFERLKSKDIAQVKRFIEKEKLDKVIIITTTNLGDPVIDNTQIKIIKGKELIDIFSSKRDRRTLNFILTHSTNQEDTSKILKRQKILDYVLNKYKNEEEKPTSIDIQKYLHIDIRSYFTNFFEIYKILRIPPPQKNMSGLRAKNPDKELINLWKEEFKKFIMEEIKKGKKYPSGIEIAKHFGISHIWNIVNMGDLYRELNLKPYEERRKKN